MLHSVLICLPRVVREVRFHVLFNKEVVSRWSALRFAIT